MNDIGARAKKGERFPKPQRAYSMTQIEDGKPYDIWSHYAIERFPKRWENGEDWIEFEERRSPASRPRCKFGGG